jgi:GNAT superfamily N-acetyltransferase
VTRIASESFLEIYAELLPLFHSHWLELGPFRDRMPLSPNLPVYTFLENSKQLLTLTARQDRRLIGYLIAKTGPGLHYSLTNQAITDLPYVLPEFRGRGIVVRLFRAAEAEFRKIGVGPWFAGSKINSPLHPSMHKLLTKGMGMVEQDIQYSKWLE